ncbi:MAG: DEAD/DEAH box helicase, partial [Bacillota bacterium]
YKAKRITDVDYLKRMNEVKQDYRKGYSGTVYPEKIKNNIHAQALYGVTKDILREKFDLFELDDVLAELSIDMDTVIERHSKVDWHDNPDVHKVITRSLDDLLYMLKKKHLPDLTFEQIDRIIDTIKTVALRRY